MTDQNELRDRQELEDRIAEVILDTMNKGRFKVSKRAAQAIIDEFGLTVRGDGCGYHEIYGSYDARFGKWEQR